jgi:indolepyruvate ferredoxin oxidoreductase, beta subunit
MIVGVGGQGNLLAGRIIGEFALKSGLDVKVSEVHGMSQRGGSVVTYVRIGEKVYSPMIEPGSADYIIAFEMLEALRWLQYLKINGTMIINEQMISPMPVISGAAEYPADIKERLLSGRNKVFFIKALDMAKACGNIKIINTVLLGVLAKLAGSDLQTWLDALETAIPSRLAENNKNAFLNGYSLFTN